MLRRRPEPPPRRSSETRASRRLSSLRWWLLPLTCLFLLAGCDLAVNDSGNRAARPVAARIVAGLSSADLAVDDNSVVWILGMKL